jgi:hypothetical protein
MFGSSSSAARNDKSSGNSSEQNVLDGLAGGQEVGLVDRRVDFALAAVRCE